MSDLRPLNWIRTNYHEFKFHGEPAHCERWEAKTPLKDYKVMRMVSQRFSYRWTGMTHNVVFNPAMELFLGGQFDSGADDLLGGKEIILCISSGR